MNTIDNISSVSFNGYLDKSVYKFTKRVINDECVSIRNKAHVKGETLTNNDLATVKGWGQNLLKRLKELVQKHTGDDTIVGCQKDENATRFYMQKTPFGALSERSLGTFETSLKGLNEFISSITKDGLKEEENKLSQDLADYKAFSFPNFKTI